MADLCLTLDELSIFVGQLSDEAVVALAEGPIEDTPQRADRKCRLCQVLGDKIYSVDTMEGMAALALVEFHDGHEFSDDFQEVRDKLDRADYKTVRADLLVVQGNLQYSRCCTIYALARAATAVRAAGRGQDVTEAIIGGLDAAESAS